MDLGLKDKKALVLGASAGLGFAVGAELVKEGARVALCSRSEERIRAAAAKMGAALGVAADLSVPGATKSVVERARESLGGLDILVINTGNPPAGSLLEVSDAQWQEAFQSLWLGAVEGIRAAVPIMRAQRWGRIILLTSVYAREPMPWLTISSGLRAGMLALTKTVSLELAEHGVTVNSVLPGYHDIERLRQFNIPMEQMTSQIPLKRLGRPEELGALVTFLSSERAAYITGQSIAIDGGWMRGF
jgi:3-oxoacyl-[acyl-carrier protein] reductase